MAEGEIDEVFLSNLMQEVAAEAKRKAAIAKVEMQETIQQQIAAAKAKYNLRKL